MLEPKAPFHERVNSALAREAAPSAAHFRSSRPSRPVFLVGCHRSGTTLLERLLSMNPEIADWSEANEVWDPSWFPWSPRNLDEPPLEFDPVAFTERWFRANADRMDEVASIFGNFQDMRGRPVFLNKTPYHVYRLPYIRQFFPEAKLIYIVRDGRGVINSHMKKIYVEGKLREWPEEQRTLFTERPEEFAGWLARYWSRAVREVEKQDRALRLSAEGIMFKTTYEELCEDTPGVLGEICDFIGVEKAAFLERVGGITVQNSNHKWRKGLSEASQRRVLEEIAPDLERLDYL